MSEDAPYYDPHIKPTQYGSFRLDYTGQATKTRPCPICGREIRRSGYFAHISHHLKSDGRRKREKRIAHLNN